MEESDFIVLGGGLAGLAAGCSLGHRAIVLERDTRPGGLVKTTCFKGYWFDHMPHLLYFNDSDTEARVRTLLGNELAWCPPEAWVETLRGTTRFPFQMHLGGLKEEIVVTCLSDLAQVTFNPHIPVASNFEQALLKTFGRSMYEIFFFPYNRKVWKRPLHTLAPSGFQWNITRPEFDQVVRGALYPGRRFDAYNSKGWYPRPARGSLVRGMEVLTRALASCVPRLLLEHAVESVDLEARTVTARHKGRPVSFHFRKACCTTLPLPRMVAMCCQTPDSLRKECQRLVHNRVVSVTMSIKGPRPEGRGHWRYYADPSLIFNRLIYMHAFDPDSAAENAWGLLAEITEESEEPLADERAIVKRVHADAKRAGAIPADCQITESHILVADPAYVVFTIDTKEIVARARTFLEEHGIMTLGRYGTWGYMSMSQVMHDGFAWGEAMKLGIKQ